MLDPLDPAVIYEDERFLSVVKPCGLQVHAARAAADGKKAAGRAGREAARRAEPTLVDWLLERYPEIKTVGDDPAHRPGIVHRLDKGTSGVMLVARTRAAYEYLKKLFQNHEIKKTYLAVVHGVPRERRGTIDAPIGIRSGTLKRSLRSPKMAKPAVTEYRVIKTFERAGADGRPAAFSLLEVFPKTGRTHQVRVHLASIGHPVAGDTLYGPKRRAPWALRLMLHALSLEFTDLSGKRIKVEAEPPEGFR